MHHEALDAVIETVRASGLRVTPQRRAILRVLIEERSHLTAQEVYERLRPLFPELSLDTVYRTLRTLAGMGIVCQSHLQTRHANRFSLALERHHHHHLICLDCGESIEFQDCALPAALSRLAERYDFVPTGHAFEVYGYCARCRDAGMEG